jgi:hypothetical protein
MAVSLLDTGETPFLPPYLSKLPGGEWSAPPPFFLLVLYTFKIQITEIRSLKVTQITEVTEIRDIELHNRSKFRPFSIRGDAAGCPCLDSAQSRICVCVYTCVCMCRYVCAGGSFDLPKETVDWIKRSKNLFYAWHFCELFTTLRIRD